MWGVDSSSEKTCSRVNWVQIIKKSMTYIQERVADSAFNVIRRSLKMFHFIFFKFSIKHLIKSTNYSFLLINNKKPFLFIYLKKKSTF